MMKRSTFWRMSILLGLGFISCISATHAQNSNKIIKTIIDIEKESPLIESRDSLYAQYIFEGDSVSIAAMYSSDGMILGGQKDQEILSSIGKWIRNNIKNDSRHVSFKMNTLTAEDELLIETGTANSRNDAGELKYSFRYLVVWKKEDGVWKIYRDIPL